MRKTGKAERKTVRILALKRPVMVEVTTGPSLLSTIPVYPAFPA